MPLFICIWQSARTRTASSVTTSSSQNRAEKTLSRIGITHGTMYKGFYSQSRLILYVTYLIKRKLSGRYNTTDSKLLEKFSSIDACNCHLRTSMKLQSRKMLTHHHQSAYILYNYTIQSCLIKRCQIGYQVCYFFFLYQGIYCKIYFLLKKMSNPQCFYNFFFREIMCIGSCSKFISTQIYCICACIQC